MITKLSLQDFTLFPSAVIRFGALNVIHGANSSGKTHLLQLCYSICASLVPGPHENTREVPGKRELGDRLTRKLGAVFRPDGGKVGRLVRRAPGEGTARVDCTIEGAGTLAFSFRRRSERVKIDDAPPRWLPQAPVFFPAHELLSVYPGFVSLYETQAIPFPETWRDTCLLLGAPIARGPKKADIAALLEPLEKEIACKAVLEGDRFFLRMRRPNAKVEADLVAEGYRKLSMVARLIANGSVDDKGYLFWDEPEANLNARLVRGLAPILLDLAANGVQVFVATHSLFFMRELEIVRAKKRVSVRYIGLHPEEDGVVVRQGDNVADSGDIAALAESIDQWDRYLVVENA